MNVVLPRQVLLTLLVIVALNVVGTVGFHLLEQNLPLFDSLYLTVITLGTVGYGDVHPKTVPGRTFAMVLVISGVFVLFYAMTALIRVVVSGELRMALEKRQMERALELLKGHIVVCGYGHMGRHVCREFSRAEMPFVVVDNKPDIFKDFELPNGLALEGDATSDEMLRHVGIERAKALVSVMASDADNLFTTMSARLLNPKLYIVARMEEMAAEKKLLRAGANRVISPYQIGGTRMAHAVIRPTVVDFIELATREEHIELQMEEMQVGLKSPLAGKAIRDAQILTELNLLVVAIKKSGGHMVFKPTSDALMEAGDTLVAIGHRDQLGKLAQRAGQAD